MLLHFRFESALIKMISIYELKPAFQSFLRPLVRQLASIGVKANHVTIFAAILSISVGFWLGLAAKESDWKQFCILPLWMFLRMALNAMDGMLAREFNQKTPLGTYLNELTDVVSDAFLYLPFAFIPWFGFFPVVIFIWLAALSEMTGVMALMVNQPRCYAGPLGKSDRAFVIGALGLWLAFAGAPSAHQQIYWEYTFPVLSLLLIINIINRVRLGLYPPH
jgi:CDP-diacylglycerol---glycerol-3-phosphate 3-phosphatidyltransferase